MSPEIVTILTFASTALLIGGAPMLVYEMWFRYREQVRGRLGTLSVNAPLQGAAVLDTDQLHQLSAHSRSDWRSKGHDLIAQAGSSIRMRALLTASAASGVAAAVVCAAITRHWASVIAGVMGAALPFMYLVMRRKARRRRLTWQLPEAFDAMNRAVRAGQTVQAAFQLVGDELEPPVSDEFRRCFEQQNLGMSYDTALRSLARRTGIMELQILVVALLVQARSGGSLAELLANLSEMVRKRLKLHQKVRALTGEGRMQAVTLIVLPVLAFIFLYFASPDYISALLRRPWLLATTVAMQACGAIWIRRIVNFDY